MNKLFIATMFSLVLGVSAQAATIMQCAVDKVGPDGVRVNILKSGDNYRLNLVFGTTVSGTMYNAKLEQGDGGQAYIGSIKGKSEKFVIQLNLNNKPAKNSNIKGVEAHVNAVVPDLNSETKSSQIDADLVCGKKISSRWN